MNEITSFPKIDSIGPKAKARSVVRVCALLSLLIPFQRAAFASTIDSITFIDNNDLVTANINLANTQAAGGSYTANGCNGTTGVCTISITAPASTFGAGGYTNFEILDPDGAAFGDTLLMSGPGLILTWTTDLGEIPVSIPGSSPTPSSSAPNTPLWDGFSFNTSSFGAIGIDINFQQINDADVAPEPATALPVLFGFVGVLGTGILRQARQRTHRPPPEFQRQG